MSKHHYTRPVLLEMAVAIEKSARDFYTTLSRRFSEHEALFKQLANDEEGHAKTYTRLLSGKEFYSTEEDRMQADYNIQALDSEGVFVNLRRGSERAREVPDLKSAVEAAVQQEKDTMLFYYALAMGLGREDREEIYKIIRVEHSHLYKVQHITL